MGKYKVYNSFKFKLIQMQIKFMNKIEKLTSIFSGYVLADKCETESRKIFIDSIAKSFCLDTIFYWTVQLTFLVRTEMLQLPAVRCYTEAHSW